MDSSNIIKDSNNKNLNDIDLVKFKKNISPKLQNFLKRSKSMTTLRHSKLEEFSSSWETFCFRIAELLDNNYFICSLSIVTILVLFESNIMLLCFNAESDFYFDIFKICCFCLFIIEFGLSCALKIDYNLSFYFWLDFISTLSILVEVNIIFQPLLNAM